ncbi:MAG: hypothetical protein OEN20_08655 [Gammaproteobacteria bacterium]|nr:hypothetical protein [Gammaproteobacteria bacterium]
MATKYVFRPGYINPGRKAPQLGVAYRCAGQVYELLPLTGIDAPDLARVMVEVGLQGTEKRILENRDLRRLARA